MFSYAGRWFLKRTCTTGFTILVVKVRFLFLIFLYGSSGVLAELIPTIYVKTAFTHSKQEPF